MGVYYPSSSNMVASNIVPLTQSTIMSVLENKANGNVCRGPSTKFHSSHVAPISVSNYIQRIMHFGRCSVDDLLLASYYLDQMLKKNPAILYNCYTAHRLLLTAILLANKYINDSYFNNKAFAKIGGVSLGEMNSLEMEFLNCISYKLTYLIMIMKLTKVISFAHPINLIINIIIFKMNLFIFNHHSNHPVNLDHLISIINVIMHQNLNITITILIIIDLSIIVI